MRRPLSYRVGFAIGYVGFIASSACAVAWLLRWLFR